jgi:hypothetical protein
LDSWIDHQHFKQGVLDAANAEDAGMRDAQIARRANLSQIIHSDLQKLR